MSDGSTNPFGDFSLVCIDTSTNEACATYREVNPSKKARNFESTDIILISKSLGKHFYDLYVQIPDFENGKGMTNKAYFLKDNGDGTADIILADPWVFRSGNAKTKCYEN